MKEIIPPIDRQLLKAELTSSTFVRKANNGDNLIYIINNHNAPNTLLEIGRLRELTFRAAGGGTGLDCDLDDFDTCENSYEQLVVWNEEDQEIVGGYRYILCKKAIMPDGNFHLATTELFSFSELFKTKYLPLSIELGRSFVQPQYQPSVNNRKGLFSLDNLWDGLGALTIIHPEIEFFFGKVTTYRHFNLEARDFILRFMQYYFPDTEKLVWPHHEVEPTADTVAFVKDLEGKDYKEGHKILNTLVRSLGENIPPLVNAYMNLSATMKSFGTAVNEEFGDVDETGILVAIDDIYPTKKERHVNTYVTPKK